MRPQPDFSAPRDIDVRNTPDLPFVCNGCGVLVKDPSERVLEDPRGYCEQCLDESDKATEEEFGKQGVKKKAYLPNGGRGFYKGDVVQVNTQFKSGGYEFMGGENGVVVWGNAPGESLEGQSNLGIEFFPPVPEAPQGHAYGFPSYYVDLIEPASGKHNEAKDADGDPLIDGDKAEYLGEPLSGQFGDLQTGTQVQIEDAKILEGEYEGEIIVVDPQSKNRFVVAPGQLRKNGVKKVAAEDIGKFLEDYLTCALWSSTDIFEGAEDQVNGDPLDKHFDISNINEESKQKAQQDCESFLQQVEAAGLELNEDAGHDFWLTRNGHGAEFWDGDYEKEVGQKLTDIAKSFGEANPYVGDDGQVYIQ